MYWHDSPMSNSFESEGILAVHSIFADMNSLEMSVEHLMDDQQV